MNTILMAMDFSPSSINAFQHAISIAEKFKSTITILWNETNEDLKHLHYTKDKPISVFINEKIGELNSMHNPNNIPTHIILSKGTSYKEVIATSEKIDADLIIVGHSGKHGFKRFFIGDNANKIIALSKCPVLTIQLHRSISEDLKKIVIAIDNTLETRQKVPITIEFAAKFRAEVHVIGIYSSSVSTMKMRVDSYVKQAVAGLKTRGITTHYHFVNTSNISKSTINYANQIGANLIVTMVDTEYFSQDMFMGKQAQQLVNQSLIPVLSVRNKEIIKTTPGM